MWKIGEWEADHPVLSAVLVAAFIALIWALARPGDAPPSTAFFVFVAVAAARLIGLQARQRRALRARSARETDGDVS